MFAASLSTCNLGRTTNQGSRRDVVPEDVRERGRADVLRASGGVSEGRCGLLATRELKSASGGRSGSVRVLL